MESLNTIFNNEKIIKNINFAKKIIHFPRSLTGEGVRNTQEKLELFCQI